MLTFDPAWSVVFDAGVCVAILWLVRLLSRRRPFRAAGPTALLALGAAACVPVLWIGKGLSLAVSLVVVPWLAIEAYNDTEQPLPPRHKILLTLARILVFLIVIACLLRPRLEFRNVFRPPMVAVVLADVSASMQVKDCGPERSRYAALRAVLEKHSDAIRSLRRDCDYRFATFAGAFERADDLPEIPSGRQTDLAAAFEGVQRDLGGARAAGIVLLSDGRHNARGAPVAAARRLGAPVFAVLLGQARGSSESPDSSIQNVDCPERVFVGNAAGVSVRVAYDGPEVNQLVEVKLTADGKVVGSERIAMPGPGKTTDVEFRYVPKSEGIKKLVATVTPAEKDANVRNNTKEIFVRASKSALHVLLIEGEVRWEYKFLRRAIAGAPNIQLLCLNAFLADPRNRSALLPRTEKDWADLSLLILGDIPADRFTPAQLSRIQKFVAEGGALLMIGGFQTLGPGGYGGTPVAKILPVDVKRDDPQTLDAVRLLPTEDGLEHRILEFGKPGERKKIWEALPPISGYTRVTGVKPAAKVLLRSPGGDPVLVVQRYEKGRTAVFAGDTTWRWIFNKGPYAKYHKAFWRQLVQWLTKSGYGGPGGGIWVETDRLRYLTGEVPILTVRAGGKRLDEARIVVIVREPGGGTTRLAVGVGPGEYPVGLPKPVTRPGRYEVLAVAHLADKAKTRKGEKDPEARTRFVVQEIDVENENPGADPKMLDAIAAATGGKVFTPDQAGRAFAEVYDRRRGPEIARPTYRRLWDNVFVYFAIAGLLCAEWIVRKRKGLA